MAVPDHAASMPGRGAYLCWSAAEGAPADACLRLAVERGGIARTLRCKASLTLVESVGHE